MTGTRHKRRPTVPGIPHHRISWLNAIALGLMAAGIVMAFAGRHVLRWAPPAITPARAASNGARGGAPGNGPGSAPGSAHAGSLPGRFMARPMARSIPVNLRIPDIRARARVVPLGLNPDGAIAFPAWRNRPGTIWYDAGATPGQRGAAALFGRVDAAPDEPAGFFKLGMLRPGSRVYLALRDHRVAVFRVSSVARYLTAAFPAAKVFGPTRWPSLRLVACGEAISKRTGQCHRTIVAFARYAGRPGSRQTSG
jgi:hypothetical protein